MYCSFAAAARCFGTAFAGFSLVVSSGAVDTVVVTTMRLAAVLFFGVSFYCCRGGRCVSSLLSSVRPGMLSAVLLFSSISADAEADAAADEVAARTAALCRGLAVLLACTVGLSSATATGCCDVSIVVVPCNESQYNFMKRKSRCPMKVGCPFFNHVTWCAQSWQVR